MTPAELLVTRLGAFLGPEMARSTVNTFCKRQVGVAPDALKPNQVLLVLPSFKSMLSTLIGTTHAQTVINQITSELSK